MFRAGREGPWLYRLPHDFDEGRCRVTVGMIEGTVEETSSWLQLKVDAGILANACHQPSDQTPKFRIGGSVRSGLRKGIEIEISKIPRPLGPTTNSDDASVEESSESSSPTPSALLS